MSIRTSADHVCAPSVRTEGCCPNVPSANTIRTLPDQAVFTRATLRQRGWTDPSISRAVRAGRLLCLRRGVLTASPYSAQLAARAAAIACNGAVVSFRSALRMHGLPIVGAAERWPEITNVPFGTGHLAGASLHRATLPASDVVDVDGCRVTSVARTLVDVARARPITTAVAAFDAALHRRLTTMDEIEQVTIACWNWPGIGRALRALRFVDGRAESPLESVSRLVIGWLRLPAPEPQVLVLDERGVVLARLDFYWDDVGVAGEADGRSKYDDRSVITNEKERQESVEDLGVAFARWGWSHTTRPQLLRSKIQRAFERGRSRDRSGLRRSWSVRAT